MCCSVYKQNIQDGAQAAQASSMLASRGRRGNDLVGAHVLPVVFWISRWTWLKVAHESSTSGKMPVPDTCVAARPSE